MHLPEPITCRTFIKARPAVKAQSTSSTSQADDDRGRAGASGQGYVADEESGSRSQSVPGFRGQDLNGGHRSPRSRSFTTEDRALIGSGRISSLPKESIKQKAMQQKEIKTPKYPLHGSFPTVEPNTKLLTNRFEHAIDARELFEYMILLMLQQKPSES